MKKRLALLLSVLLILSLGLVGCASNGDGGEATNDADTGGVQELSFATGGTSGTYYPLGGAIANTWNKTIDGINVTIQPAGASVENINRVSSGEVDMVLAMNNIADQAYNGYGDSFASAMTDFEAVGVVYPEVVHIITTQDSGIETIYDLQGKTINPGPPGSGTYVTAMEVLNVYGVDDYKSSPGSFSDAVAGLKDGNIDAAFAVLSFPASAVTEIATSKDVKILEVDDAEFEVLLETVPFAAKFDITGGEYKGQDEDAQTIALQAVLYVKKGLDEELVYNLTKEMYENTDQIAQGHARGKQISIDNALDGVTTPVHPGAMKYYEEQGLQ